MQGPESVGVWVRSGRHVRRWLTRCLACCTAEATQLRQPAETCPPPEGVLRRTHVRGVAMPRGEGRILEGPSKREAQEPRVRTDPVHGIEMGRGILGTLTTGQEDDPGNGRWNGISIRLRMGTPAPSCRQ